MGQNWIKWRKNLESDPRVLAMSRALSVSRNEVLGALTIWFGYADEHTVADPATNDGTMPMVDYELIDSPQVTGLSGMANQLERIGWIKQEGDSLRVVNFQDHMGDGAKGRAMGAARQSRRRSNVTHDALPEKTRRDETRPEKKTEAARVTWSESDGFVFDDKFRDAMTKSAPGVDLDREIARANAWLIANPDRRKKRYARFLMGWVNRSQEDMDKKPKPERDAGLYDSSWTEKK